ncbi:MAG: RluA family pseudouridine synthase [Anaerolineales bacterium]|nr:RluA family pseudouridine synthase [Anaerolineales bacterium]
MKEDIILFSVPPPGGRLDHILVSQVEEFSRSRLQKIIREGWVLVDNRVETKPAFRLEGGEVIELTIPPIKPSTLNAEDIPLDIIFENDDFIVINKPAGMVVHPSAGHETGTLVHAVLAHDPNIRGVGGEQRPGIVHRLDKDTSGVILLAKHDTTHRDIQNQFSQRKIKKNYTALVDGHPPTPVGRIEASIGRDKRHRKKMAVVRKEKGRDAISLYKTLESFQEHSLLEVEPITGRTHQIRLHLAFIKCPVVGDLVYGRRKSSIPIGRQFLHAAKIQFQLPDGGEIYEFEAPLPSDLQVVLEELRRQG